MSYILEALKKSEAERNRRNAPMRLMNDPGTAPRRRVWPKALALALAFNTLAAGGVWWHLQEAPKAGETPVAQAPGVDAQGGAAGEPLRIEPEQPLAPDQGQLEVAAAQPDETDGEPGRLVRFRSLPLEERARFPQLDFSSHLYASDPSMRRVVVNERSAREGDALTGGLTLEEITETGVVVRYRDRRVAIDVTRHWQP